MDISDEKPIRGDVPEETEQKIVAQLPAQISGLVYIQNEKYPKLNEKGRFIPQRRIIHLDLKGAAYKVGFFKFLFTNSGSGRILHGALPLLQTSRRDRGSSRVGGHVSLHWDLDRC